MVCICVCCVGMAFQWRVMKLVVPASYADAWIRGWMSVGCRTLKSNTSCRHPATSIAIAFLQQKEPFCQRVRHSRFALLNFHRFALSSRIMEV